MMNPGISNAIAANIDTTVVSTATVPSFVAEATPPARQTGA